MRVSTFSRASVIAIICFAALFLTAMFQVANTLADNRRQLEEYQHLKALVTVDFYRTISSYLQSGDASLLNQAENQLKAINQSAHRLAINELSEQLTPVTTKLTNDIDSKYRAWGKLSGDPFALLRNNEQGLSALNYSLGQYAVQSEELSSKQQLNYLNTNANIGYTLQQLVTARERLLSQDANNQQAINQAMSELGKLGTQLSQFPLLGIIEQADDEDELGDDLMLGDEEEAIDLSEEALNEFISISKRYQSDLQSTLSNQVQRQQGLTLLTQDVETMEQVIIKAEAIILSTQQQLNQRITWVVVVLMSILVIFLAANYWLTRKVVLNPLRQLRDSFVQLVTDGRVDMIQGIDERTELGQISTSFNKMVSQLADEDKQKATQLGLVSTAMKTMETQAKTILNSSSSTSEHLKAVDQIMIALSQVTEHVNTLSQQVVDNAQATQQAMGNSQQQVSEVLSASQQTNIAAQSGKAAIDSLTQSVESVGLIVDVISSIADQTNLLALNAAIEAARAGEHGRGFSVVADEVRQLAGKTQESLNQVSSRLEQLNQASETLAQSIIGIEQASGRQQEISALLKDNAENVVEQAVTSANVAADTLAQINQQRQYFVEFEQAIQSVNNEVSQSRTLAENISHDVASQVTDISQTLKIA